MKAGKGGQAVKSERNRKRRLSKLSGLCMAEEEEG